MSELKPCPFCGEPAEMFGAGVICPKCFAVMTENTARGESMGYEVSPVEMWNTRAECRHVKPRTLEDVLKEVMAETRLAVNPNHWIVEKYAAEIRELLGVDA